MNDEQSLLQEGQKEVVLTQQYMRKSGDVAPRISNFGTGCRDELYASPALIHGENERPVPMG
jgi:hypothetical protein